MELQIIMPQYEDVPGMLKPLLNIFATNCPINFDDVEIIINNYKNNAELPKEFLDSYPFNIQYFSKNIREIPVGVSVLDCLIPANYIAFCDNEGYILPCLQAPPRKPLTENILKELDIFDNWFDWINFEFHKKQISKIHI